MSTDRYTLPEVAGLLNKSQRQIRYLIKTGKLPAHKPHGRWTVKKSDLDIFTTAPQADAVQRTEAAHAAGRRYSVQDLQAFQVGQTIFRDMVEALTISDPNVKKLRNALEALTLGCHAFEPDEKIEYFRRVRRTLASIVAALLLPDEPPADDDDQAIFAGRIEQELMPHIGGLIRAADRKQSDDRFRRFSGRRQ